MRATGSPTTITDVSVGRGAPGTWWAGSPDRLTNDPRQVEAALRDVARPCWLIATENGLAAAEGGSIQLDSGDEPLAAYLPACHPRQFGDASFLADHGVRFPYVAGAMANGIASADLVEAVSRAGMLGFFGAAGLGPERVASEIDRLQRSLPNTPFGFNLIHSPNEPRLEEEIAELYIRRGVRLVEASAYLDLTPAIVRYRLHGIHEDAAGRIVTPNRVIGKVSRVEVATRFLSPAPDRIIRELLDRGLITAQQAALSKRIPIAQDLTAEADSGGHTDNRPAISLLPTMIALRDRLADQFRYDCPLRVGAAGGISTPASVAAAFAMGAAFVVTGSINQACVESGSSDVVRQMLAEAEQADVTMAPAADMFEMGVKVQVLKRGTMFAMRAAKLHELYRTCASLDAIPATERANLEKSIFRLSVAEVWAQTREFFTRRDPSQIVKAESDPKHKMALVFRWYLGQSSRWANAGLPDRRLDYQVWCGPAMGAFNDWVKGSFLERASERRAVTVAMNLLYGAAYESRLALARMQGVALPREWTVVRPRPLHEIESALS